MSRRRAYARRTRSHTGMSRTGAAVVFLALCGLLGGIADAVPRLTGLVGFMVLVVGVLCWLAAGTRRH